MFKIEEEKNSIKYLSYLEKLSKMFAHDKIVIQIYRTTQHDDERRVMEHFTCMHSR